MVIVNTEDSRNSAWAKDKTGFGHRMLSKMGWKEGKGLGKDGQGQSTNLRGVRRAEETLGIGASTDTHGSDGWGKTNQNFHGVLANLRVHHSDVINKKEKKRRKKEKKERKKLNDSGSSNETNGLVLAQNRVSAGHARKMRDAKDLSNKSQEDMAAIFGVTPQLFQFQKMKPLVSSMPKKETIRDVNNDNDSTSHVVSDASEEEVSKKAKDIESSTKKSKKSKKDKKRKRKSEEVDGNKKDKVKKGKKCKVDKN